jgi:4-hydroxy-tetrahydrodipicolinate reductase
MKIALLGYGKMGKIIAQMAVQRGHEIVYKSSASNQSGNFKDAEIAIEFSTPEAAVANITKCFKANIPVVSGTTGWLDQKKIIEEACLNSKGSFIYASNFSIGVNLFFNLNEHLVKLMKPWSDYKVSIEEIHHIEKKDAPSGTAITLVEDILPYSDKNTWSLDHTTTDAVGIKSRREADVKGTHSVSFTSKIDTITIKHEAHSREGFAMGAVIAAEFLVSKKGIFTMKDVLGL